MGSGGKTQRLDIKNEISVNEGVAKKPGQGDMEFLTPYDLHRRWGRAISLKTLANWRSLGYGPPYSKLGGRVLYRVTDILTWENQHRFITRM